MERVRLGRAPRCSNMPHWTKNDILDLQRAMPMKMFVENRKICYQTTMGERLERIGRVWIFDEMDCFRLGFIEKMERRFRITTLDMRAALKGRSNLETVIIGVVLENCHYALVSTAILVVL